LATTTKTHLVTIQIKVGTGVARFFLVQHTKAPKIYQMAIKYSNIFGMKICHPATLVGTYNSAQFRENNLLLPILTVHRKSQH
jgi:hypothetical protein